MKNKLKERSIVDKQNKDIMMTIQMHSFKQKEVANLATSFNF